MSYIRTPGGIHMVIDGKPIAVAQSDKHFQSVLEALKRKATDSEILDILDSEKRRMEAAVQVSPGIEIKGGQLYYQHEPVAGVLGERMMQMVDEGFDLTPMAAFLRNLMENPSKRVVDHLYGFLEYGKNAITEDGCFLAYKAVSTEYKDIYTGTFDNSVGQVVKMPRNRVNEDPNQTCSDGLHVCSFEYLDSAYARNSGHVMICKINPAHVVAVPTDYNNTKMRVCEYVVIGENVDYYDNKNDTLSATSVATSSNSNFRVDVDYGSGYVHHDDFERLSEAGSVMEACLDDNDVKRVRVVNINTDAVVDEQDNPDYDDGEGSGDDKSYTIFGIQSGGGRIQLEDDFDSVNDAVMEALEYENGVYIRIEIVDQNGTVVKTLS